MLLRPRKWNWWLEERKPITRTAFNKSQSLKTEPGRYWFEWRARIKIVWVRWKWENVGISLLLTTSIDSVIHSEHVHNACAFGMTRILCVLKSVISYRRFFRKQDWWWVMEFGLDSSLFFFVVSSSRPFRSTVGCGQYRLSVDSTVVTFTETDPHQLASIGWNFFSIFFFYI